MLKFIQEFDFLVFRFDEFEIGNFSQSWLV